MTFLQLAQTAQEHPVAALSTALGSGLAAFAALLKWGLGRFEKFAERVEQKVEAHEVEDTRRFAAIEERANDRHVTQMTEINRHANQTTVSLGDMMSELRVLAERREKPRDS